VTAAYADSHLHLLAYARALGEPDLGPAAAPSVADVVVLAAEAARPRASGWAVLRGFDHSLVGDRRLLRRAELDAVCRHPVRIRHRTGHASLLNTAAFERLPSPPRGARLEVDDRGDPVMLVGAETWLNRVCGPPLRGSVVDGLTMAARDLTAVGIDRVWDATPRTADAVTELRGLLHEARFPLCVRWMRLATDLPGSGDLEGETVKLFPEEHGLRLPEMVAAAHRRGATVAIHAVTADELNAAVGALARTGGRIEHAPLVTDAQAARMAAAGIVVVTHPGWLTSRREKHRRELTPQTRRQLFPLRRLMDAGVELAFASDAPIEAPDPRLWVEIATARPWHSIPLSVADFAARGAALWLRPALELSAA
jgi:hypothetical protein